MCLCVSASRVPGCPALNFPELGDGLLPGSCWPWWNGDNSDSGSIGVVLAVHSAVRPIAYPDATRRRAPQLEKFGATPRLTTYHLNHSSVTKDKSLARSELGRHDDIWSTARRVNVMWSVDLTIFLHIHRHSQGQQNQRGVTCNQLWTYLSIQILKNSKERAKS